MKAEEDYKYNAYLIKKKKSLSHCIMRFEKKILNKLFYPCFAFKYTNPECVHRSLNYVGYPT